MSGTRASNQAKETRVCEIYPGVGPPVELMQQRATRTCEVIRQRGQQVDLVYFDPPFAANRRFDWSIRVVHDDGEETVVPRRGYDDRWESFQSYLAFMREHLLALRDILSPEGSLLLHCDHSAAPYLAILCDELFGMGDRLSQGAAPGFRNELIWSYGLGGSSARSYPKKHDTILWYSMGATWYFDPPMVPATSLMMAGKLKKAPDVLQVPSINNRALERSGYPTQKPLALLEQLVRAHCPPEGLVFDPMCGSGTTAVAAARTGRRCVVSDASRDAIRVASARLIDEAFAVELTQTYEGSWQPADPTATHHAPSTQPFWFMAWGRHKQPGTLAISRARIARTRESDGRMRDGWTCARIADEPGATHLILCDVAGHTRLIQAEAPTVSTREGGPGPASTA